MERRRDWIRIRELNDRMRQDGPQVSDGMLWVVTTGVQALGSQLVVEAMETVRTFSAFGPDNDPHGEHDFGSFDLSGHRLFWKIDYYNRALNEGSPDAADPDVTCRVLTILLAMEY